MENRTINLGVVAEVAEALKELKNQMIFVGGAVVSLYADDAAADEIRPTADIDMAIRLLNFNNWTKLQERLAELGFHPDPFGHAICSYKYKDIPVDIMSSKDGPLGPANRWYELGFENVQTIQLENLEIQIFSAPVYLAAKLEAFNDRGKDYRTSHDFEDVIYVLDNRMGICEEIAKTHPVVLTFLKSELAKAYNGHFWDDILISHIHPIMLAERGQILTDKVIQIINL